MNLVLAIGRNRFKCEVLEFQFRIQKNGKMFLSAHLPELFIKSQNLIVAKSPLEDKKHQ